INPGNSGGGLFNEYGELVGVIEAKSSGSDVEGLGFAVPVNTAAEVAEQIMSGKFEAVGKAFTGMSYGETGSDSGDEGGMEDFFNFGEPSVTYVYIAEVISSNAKKAGFKENDVVLSVDGQDIDSIDTLKSVIQKHKPGDKVKYEILRGNKTISIKLTLEKTTD
ncbi:MAG: PDZ domain-containing protein, partial [Eubacterium sp.]|nr:PDZ domain-containing protein [Eubacterium sp.]